MPPVESLWVYLAERPLLWLTLTVGAYVAAHRLYRGFGELAILNPVLVSVVLIIAVLRLSGTDYATYFEGAQFVHFLLGPATVAIAVPLYRQSQELRRLWRPLTAALLAGSLTAVLSALGLGWLLGLDQATLLSLVPKSVTTPVAMGIAEQVGGLPSLTAVLVILTGVVGAVAGLPLLAVLGIREATARGLAMGVAAHGIGTARAFQSSERAGAFSGLGMGLNAALTALLVPLLLYLLKLV
ncbi:LrgB family protein [Ectothiorhodospiraceae bacterium WFHF3C12]|nr:LrgB family protein [Ectothiorhodospiraceae bacterium WFHF3C12]